ncbi:hypothetical protein DFH28DRAFT_1032862 [Melampsora americana]|nr:hypothetical protein DFH28DRAFT_1032862 [Melampsora americana]
MDQPGSPSKRKLESDQSSRTSSPNSSNRIRRRVNRFDTSNSEDDENGKRAKVSSPTKWFLLRLWCRKWEVPRKVLHSSIGFITLHLYMADGNPSVIAVHLSKALIVIWIADVLRFNSKRFSSLYETLLGFLMRPSEKNNWNGVIFYLIGVIISLSTLPLDISVLSILILSWVDTSASIVGRLWGHLTPSLPSPPFARRKSLAGFLGAFLTGTVTSSLFWSSWASKGVVDALKGYSWAKIVSQSTNSSVRGSVLDYLLSHQPAKLAGQLASPKSNMSLLGLSIGCGLVGAVAEAVEVFGLDDNLIVPVLSGWGIWGMMTVFG